MKKFFVIIITITFINLIFFQTLLAEDGKKPKKNKTENIQQERKKITSFRTPVLSGKKSGGINKTYIILGSAAVTTVVVVASGKKAAGSSKGTVNVNFTWPN